ncbi:MAG: hypothetical protein QXP66_00875 [Candidatus Aenigmatarchaeota archaeon]
MQFNPNAYIFHFNTDEWAEFIPPNDNLNLCNVQGIIIDIYGNVVPNTRINLSIFGYMSGEIPIIGRPVFYPPALIHAMPKEVYTDSSGIFIAPLLRNTIVKIDIPRTGYFRLVRIPDSPQASFDQLQEISFF